MLIKNILIVISFLFITNLAAETFSKGSATVEIKKPKKVSAEETAMAKNKAVEAAWKKYTGTFNQSRMKQYMLIKEDIMSTLDDYINDVQVLDNTVDTGTKTLRTVVKISINDVAFDAKLSLTSAAGGTASGEGSSIAAYFIIREKASEKTYEEKNTEINANESAKKVTDSMEGDTDSVSTSDINKSQSGGSAEQKAAKISYKSASNVVNQEDLFTAAGKVLNPAGYEMETFENLILDVEDELGDFDPPFDLKKMEKDFVQNNGFSKVVKKNIRKVIKSHRNIQLEDGYEPFSFLVQVIADLNVPYTDSVTGNQKATAKITVNIFNIKKRQKSIASEILQVSGTGQNGSDALNNAMINGTTEAASVIVDQLNAKGIN